MHALSIPFRRPQGADWTSLRRRRTPGQRCPLTPGMLRGSPRWRAVLLLGKGGKRESRQWRTGTNGSLPATGMALAVPLRLGWGPGAKVPTAAHNVTRSPCRPWQEQGRICHLDRYGDRPRFVRCAPPALAARGASGRHKQKPRSRCFGLSLIWRRRSESNRRTRLCRPLHNHSATPPGDIFWIVSAISHPTGRRGHKPKQKEAGLPFGIERETSLELATSTLARLRSTN